MPYQITWLIDERVLYFHIEGELDPDMLREMVQESRDMANRGKNPVHAIVDATRAESIPKHIQTIIQEYKNQKPESSGFTVLVATSSLTRFFAQMVFKVFRLEVRFAADLDDAFMILQRVDTTLPIQPKSA